MVCGQVCCPPDPSASRDGPGNPSRTWLLVTLLAQLALPVTLDVTLVVFRGLGGGVRWLGCCCYHLRRHHGYPPLPGCMCLVAWLLLAFDFTMVAFRYLGGGARWLGLALLSPSTSSWLSSAALAVVFDGWAVCQSHLWRVGVADLGRPHHLASCLLPRNREIRPPGVVFPGDQIPDLVEPIHIDGALHGEFLPVTSSAPPGTGQKSPASGKSPSPQCLHSE